MKKILLTLAIIFTFSTASFAQFDLDSLFKFGKDVMDQLGKATELTDEEEIQYGDEIATQYNGTIELTTTDQAKVEKIGNKILKYITRTSIPFKFKIMVTDQINAFSMAGGNIWITSSLLKYVDNDDQLAFVIAHEIAHEDRKHNMRRIQLLFRAKQYGGSDAEYFAMIAQNLATMPFEKYQEYEADESGVIWMKQAGYNAQAALDFFTKLSNLDPDGEKDLGYIYRSHPYPGERKNNIKKYVN